MAKLEARKGRELQEPGQPTSGDRGQYLEAENLDLLWRVRGRALYRVMTSMLCVS